MKHRLALGVLCLALSVMPLAAQVGHGAAHAPAHAQHAPTHAPVHAPVRATPVRPVPHGSMQAHEEHHPYVGNRGGGYGRINDSKYRASFGRTHHFHVGRAGRFYYGGYGFSYGYWPVGWAFSDECYIVFEPSCDCYELYNLAHPGVGVIVNVY